MPNEVKLLPCRECGSDCRIETFGSPYIQGGATLFVCSNHQRFGGDCPSDLAYFDADAWNTRPTTVVTDEVVERDELVKAADALDHVASALEEVRALSDVGDPAFDASMFGQIAAVQQGASLLRRAALASMPTVVTGEQPA